MTFTLRTFVLLWLPSLALLLSGLPALLRTGQVDPRGWMLPALLLIPVTMVVKARRGTGPACWASAGAFCVVLCCAFLAASRAPALGATLWLAVMVLLVTLAGFQLGPAFTGKGWLRGLLFLVLAATATWLAREPAIQPSGDPRPKLAVISSLPLFWKEDAAGFAAPADAPIITVLRRRFAVEPLDSPLALTKRGPTRLMLAQPRGFSPEELVALDRWTAGGGQALIFADPQLHWPMTLPIGDRRRPPAVTLLAGLLDHWGVYLAPVAGAGERRHFLFDGRVLALHSASLFETARSSCRITEGGVVTRCKVGAGIVVIVADADLLDDRLWLADPHAPLDPSQWTADTPEFVARTLGADLPGSRRWVRSGTALVEAIRWAVLFGILWAALGALLFGAPLRGPSSLARRLLNVVTVNKFR